MHNLTPLGISMYLKELDRQADPKRLARGIIGWRFLKAACRIFAQSDKFPRKIGIWTGSRGREPLTDVARGSQFVAPREKEALCR